jgi:transposase, IS30 family
MPKERSCIWLIVQKLSINEREEISLGLAQGFSKNYIALSLGRSSSTICREVNRNTANGQVYRAVKAKTSC